MEFSNLLNFILIILGTVVFLPCLIFFLECWATLKSPSAETSWQAVKRPRTTILIPAHNEAKQIKEVIETLIPQLQKQDQVIVVADNCHDNTAELARLAGAEVLERENLVERGKGYALDYALRQKVQHNPPEVLVILDGDCLISPKTIEYITCKAIATGRPVQATYLMDQPENPSLKDNISMFSLKVKNLVRLLGLNRLGWHSLLTGSGMAFPWSLISQVSLAGSKTTDDMQLTVDLALAGSTPVFCEEALVTGRLMKDQDAQSQRSRWEHGHLEMILQEVPRLLKAFLSSGSLSALGLALDILIPPLSLLVMAWLAGATIIWLGIIFTGASIISGMIVNLAGALLLSGVLLAWVKFGRSDLPLGNLIALPLYVLGKIPIYFNFILKPQSRWLKTERDLPDEN